MVDSPASTCICCSEEPFRSEARADEAVICLFCQMPWNIASCVERNKRQAERGQETLIKRPAHELWEPPSRTRSELPRAD
jgi:hypothetical protein